MLATVKGDVHDIGKNLVDIILSNNGYDVVNIGIKQPISAIVAAAEETRADVIGMSGLLVKSTVVMRDNLAELNSRGLAGRWPVLLGGAALTRAYVEQDLAALFGGAGPLRPRRVRGAAPDGRRDGRQARRPGRQLPALRSAGSAAAAPAAPRRRRAPRRMPAPVGRGRRHPGAGAPFLGHRGRQGHPARRVRGLPGRARDVHGPVGPQAVARATAVPSYEELVETEGRPRLRMWLERMQTEGLLEAAVVYGYFRCVSAGNDLIVLGGDGGASVSGSRSPGSGATGGCAWPTSSAAARDRGETDVVAFQLATMGSAVSEATAELFAKNAYREYLELHGLSVQLTEALAEYWHARVRRELGIAGADPADLDGFFRVDYRGARYSIGYPACPDLADRAKMVRLLEPDRIGVELSEEMQLHPEQSTDAIVIHHPEAKYFSV